MATHRVYFGKGSQTLYSVPHRDRQPVRVQSATYGIFDAGRHSESSDDYIVVAAGTAGVVDPFSTTTTAKAGRTAETRRELHLTSTVGLVAGHCYLLEGPNGQAELVRLAAIPSATLALCAAEIRGDYPTASHLYGIEVAAVFPQAQADDESNLDGLPWIVVWSFHGISSPIRESVHLERGEEGQLATLDDLLELDPYLSIQGGDRISPALALARAQRDFRTDLQIAGASEADILAGTIGRDAVVYRAAQLCLHHSENDADRAKAEGYGERYQELRAALQTGSKKPGVVVLDKDQASAQAVNPLQLFKPFGW